MASLGPTVKGVASSLCCYIIKLGDYCDIESGLDLWEAHCEKYYKRWDIRMTGFVIDGSARDTDEAKMLDFPIYSHAVCPRAAHTAYDGRKEPIEINTPIVCGGVIVRPESRYARYPAAVISPDITASRIARRSCESQPVWSSAATAAQSS